MKRTLCFVMALALVLGLSQCKKEQPLEPTNEGNGVRITLNLENGNGNGAKAEVVPPNVNFVEGDTILVASNGKYVGYLVHNGTAFSGDITNPTEGQPLYFYFLGNKIIVSTLTAGTTDECTVNISDQTGYPALPVISMGVSIDRANNNAIVNYSSEISNYEAQLHNKCSLMKFNVTTPSSSAICITGMNNTVSVNFATPGGDDNGFSYAMNGIGEIKMKGQEGDGEKTYWAIVLPQASVAIGNAYTVDRAYIGTRPAIEGGIGTDQFLNAGFSMTVNTELSSSTPLTLEALSSGSIVVNQPQSGMQYSKNGGTKTTMSGTTTIDVDAGDKVQFYGNGISITSYSGTRIYGGTANVKAYGNIMSLIDEVNYATATTLSSENVFSCFFYGNNQLTDASGLLLPATTLSQQCYFQMFTNCSNLTAAPALPAETLAANCYENMFKGCSNLTKAPTELPAETLAAKCYQNMFLNCSSLTTAPALPATTLVSNCYASMFQNCSSLSSITCLATSGINSNGSTTNWVNGVVGTGTFTKASGANWTTGVNGIPSNWTVVQQ